jgi:hypothetical protein
LRFYSFWPCGISSARQRKGGAAAAPDAPDARAAPAAPDAKRASAAWSTRRTLTAGEAPDSLPPDAAPVERLNKNTRKKRAAKEIPNVRETGRFLTGLRVQAVQMVSQKAAEGSRRLPARKQLPAAPVRKNADAGGRFRWKMREGLGGSGHD